MIPFADNTTNNCEGGVSLNHDDNGNDSVERNLHEIRRQKAFQRVLTALGVSVGDTVKPTSNCTSNTVTKTTYVLTDIKEKKCQPILGQNADEVKRLLKEQRKNYKYNGDCFSCTAMKIASHALVVTVVSFLVLLLLTKVLSYRTD